MSNSDFMEDDDDDDLMQVRTGRIFKSPSWFAGIHRPFIQQLHII